MPKLEELVHSSFEDFFSIDSEGTVYDDPRNVNEKLSPRIINETTLLTIDVSALFN